MPGKAWPRSTAPARLDARSNCARTPWAAGASCSAATGDRPRLGGRSDGLSARHPGFAKVVNDRALGSSPSSLTLNPLLQPLRLPARPAPLVSAETFMPGVYYSMIPAGRAHTHQQVARRAASSGAATGARAGRSTTTAAAASPVCPSNWRATSAVSAGPPIPERAAGRPRALARGLAAALHQLPQRTPAVPRRRLPATDAPGAPTPEAPAPGVWPSNGAACTLAALLARRERARPWSSRGPELHFPLLAPASRRWPRCAAGAPLLTAEAFWFAWCCAGPAATALLAP